MQTENYRANIKEALNTLVIVNQSIYDSLIPIAMQGELKEFNDGVPIGEVHNFDFDLFKSCEDINIRLLVKLIVNVNETFETIKNINAIEYEH